MAEIKGKDKPTKPANSMEGRLGSATQRALTIDKRTLDEIDPKTWDHCDQVPDGELSAVKDLMRRLIGIEGSTLGIVAYHSVKSSLLGDVYGGIAQALEVTPRKCHVQRLEADFIELSVTDLLGKGVLIKAFDHQESVRQQLVAASPTLTSCIDIHSFESAIVFYASNDGIPITPHAIRFQSLLEKWKVHHVYPSQVMRAFDKLEQDFYAGQQGYLLQYFFHSKETADRIIYPSGLLGRPLMHGGQRCTTSEFLETFHSGNLLDRSIFEVKYGVKITDVQFRLLADPMVFLDEEEVTINGCRRSPMENEPLYQERVQREIVDPVLIRGMEQSSLASPARRSPLFRTLGDGSPLARLVDYVNNDPRRYVVEGDVESIREEIQAGRLNPLEDFGTSETLLELAIRFKRPEIVELFSIAQGIARAEQLGNQRVAQRLRYQLYA